jgi:predicted Rossmann fold nucleotide-binding protein DprA/Smf involved in DNA uptake
MDIISLNESAPNYPKAIQHYLGKDAPNDITAKGNLDILRHNSTAFFCSTKCPGDLIVKTYDIAQLLRDAGMTVISGFHSPMERESLTILLRGAQPIIICPARSINKMRINREHKKPLKDGRLLFLSPFDENHQRISTKRSYYRNLFVTALSAVVFVIHAEPSSKTEELSRQIFSWQKPIYTFDSDYNKNLIKMGARPIRPENVSEWGKLLATQYSN